MRKRDLVSIRPAVKEDHPFIYSSWLQSLWAGNETFKLINRALYFKKYHDIVENLITKANSVVLIACLLDDPDIILGFSTSEAGRLHYVFVKENWRNIGLARDLSCPFNEVSHITRMGAGIFKKHNQQVPFNPFLGE